MTTNFASLLRYGIAGLLGIVVGAATAHFLARLEKGERAMSDYMTLVKVLAYLRNNDVPNAESMLRVSVEGSLVTVNRFGAPLLDKSSPGSREAWIACYARLRRGYKPLEYYDGGATNERLDKLLSSLDTNTCPLVKR